MQLAQLKKLVLASLDDSKARDIMTLDVSKLTDITDYMIICSGTSNRHTRSIANHLSVNSKARGVAPLSIEGENTGEWILVDLADIVVHIMLPQTREFYSLEKLWSVTLQAKQDTQTVKPTKCTTAKTGAKTATRKRISKVATQSVSTAKRKAVTTRRTKTIL